MRTISDLDFGTANAGLRAREGRGMTNLAELGVVAPRTICKGVTARVRAP
jgi:hypothetical protein